MIHWILKRVDRFLAWLVPVPDHVVIADPTEQPGTYEPDGVWF